MRKILFAALLFFSALGLSATAARALEPGCSADMLTLMQHHGDAIRVRSRAYEREIIYRNESTLGLTCFDQAMRLSSRLGYIFSDVILPNPPPPDTAIFTAPLAYPDWGATALLSAAIDRVVSPVLDEYMLNFPGSDWGFGTPNALTIFVSSLSGTLAAISAAQAAENGNIAAIVALTVQIQAMLLALPGTPSTGVTAAIAAIQALMDQQDALENLVRNNWAASVGPLLAQVRALTMGADTAMVCTRMDDLWTAGNPASGFALVDPGYVAGTPYYSLQSFLNRAVPGASAIFLSELAAGGNPAILSAALTDLTALAAPGRIPSWPTTPVFPPTATTAEVIAGMRP